MITLEKAKKKAERRAGRRVIAINQNDDIWVFTFSFDDCDDFVTISKKTGLFLNMTDDDFDDIDLETIWEEQD